LFETVIPEAPQGHPGKKFDSFDHDYYFLLLLRGRKHPCRDASSVFAYLKQISFSSIILLPHSS
ncbi:MAG: hypothetical protein IIV45_04580, partial [Lachnospiraceae bacterium]|nr:hypothetical protein [Lachnospiraceae bacterium]